MQYLGEEGKQCELSGSVVCSNPWNLEAGSLALQRTWLGLEVYSKTMGGNMKKLFETYVPWTSFWISADNVIQSCGSDCEESAD